MSLLHHSNGEDERQSERTYKARFLFFHILYSKTLLAKSFVLRRFVHCGNRFLFGKSLHSQLAQNDEHPDGFEEQRRLEEDLRGRFPIERRAASGAAVFQERRR